MHKFLPLLIAWIILFSGHLMANEKQDPLKNACFSYIRALQSDRDCLVKSSMINLMRFYYTHPEKDFSQVLIELDKLANTTKSSENRYLAQVVKGYINDQLDMDWLMQFSYEQIYNYFMIEHARKKTNLVTQL